MKETEDQASTGSFSKFQVAIKKFEKMKEKYIGFQSKITFGFTLLHFDASETNIWVRFLTFYSYFSHFTIWLLWPTMKINIENRPRFAK